RGRAQGRLRRGRRRPRPLALAISTHPATHRRPIGVRGSGARTAFSERFHGETPRLRPSPHHGACRALAWPSLSGAGEAGQDLPQPGGRRRVCLADWFAQQVERGWADGAENTWTTAITRHLTPDGGRDGLVSCRRRR